MHKKFHLHLAAAARDYLARSTGRSSRGDEFELVVLTLLMLLAPRRVRRQSMTSNARRHKQLMPPNHLSEEPDKFLGPTASSPLTRETPPQPVTQRKPIDRPSRRLRRTPGHQLELFPTS